MIEFVVDAKFLLLRGLASANYSYNIEDYQVEWMKKQPCFLYPLTTFCTDIVSKTILG